MAAGDKHNKITTGFVIQNYEEQKDGELVCFGQEFVAGDQVDYENTDGEPIEPPENENYQPFNMVQPGWDFYFLYVFGGVDAKKIGPFNTEQERDNALEDHREGEGREDYDSYFPFDVAKGATVQF